METIDLFLILEGVWYWKIFNKVKPIEYRNMSKYNKRIVSREYTHVRFQLGYRADNVMRLKIERIETVESENLYYIHLDLSCIEIISYKEPAVSKTKKVLNIC